MHVDLMKVDDKCSSAVALGADPFFATNSLCGVKIGVFELPFISQSVSPSHFVI